MSLPTIPQDKANHVIYGAAIFALAGWLAVAAGQGLLARQIGVVAAFVVGIAKEAADAWANARARARGLPAPHGVEAADAVATTGGAMLAWLAATATDY